MRTSFRPAPLVTALLVAGLGSGLGGCALFSPLPTQRGQFVEQMDYNQLHPGMQRADVSNLIGSPTAKATFDDNTWIYIGEVTAPVPLARDKVVKQQVLVLNFDASGTLQNIRRLDKADAHNVSMSSRVTPSPGSDASFLQQVIGNVGRYNPMGMGGDTLGTSGLGSNNGYGHGGAGNTLP